MHPSAERPKLERTQSTVQRMQKIFTVPSPTDEERAIQLARRLRHISRRGGLNPQKLREIEASFSGSPATTPDAEAPSTYGLSFNVDRRREESESSQPPHRRARPNTLDLASSHRRVSPPEVKPNKSTSTVKEMIAASSASGVEKITDLSQSRPALRVEIPAITVTSSDLFFDSSKEQAQEDGRLETLNEEPVLEATNGAIAKLEKDVFDECQPSTSTSCKSFNFPKTFTTSAEVHPQQQPTIQVCDEHGNLLTPRDDDYGREESPDSPAAWTKNKVMSAAVRRKTSMKRQNAVDEKLAINGYISRRLTRRLVGKWSQDEESQDDPLATPSLDAAVAISDPVASTSAVVPELTTRQQMAVEPPMKRPTNLPLARYYKKRPENVHFEVETSAGPRQRRIELKAAAIDQKIAIISNGANARRATPRKQSRLSRVIDKVKSVGRAILSSMRSVVDLHEALVVNQKRHRIYTRQGALYREDFKWSMEEETEISTTEGMQRNLASLMADDMVDYRPFFTHWVTLCQVAVVIIAICAYGFGPFALSRVETTKFVPHVSGSYRLISVFEMPNLWVGPGFPDLIRAGAKYSPCMRRDRKIMAQIEEDRIAERQTGCCIMNDRSGCFQTSPDSGECSTGFAVMHHWNKSGTGFDNRKSGPVCGADPRVCRDPPYQKALWADDIIQWKVCNAVAKSVEGIPHMECEVTGRPCCIQMQGQCRITTREYCEFVNGHYHHEAVLCSQVDCLQDVCGMTPFYKTGSPNQIYRILSPMFIHAGIIGLLWTMFFQLIFMATLERMMGWGKVSTIYLCSGLGGYLASAVFVPYMPEVGPAASQGGILGALVVDGYYHWDMTLDKMKQIKNLLIFLVIFLVIGFLPWVDNYAQWFGFIYGILISIIVIPPVSSPTNRRFPSLHRVAVLIIASTLLFLLTGFPLGNVLRGTIRDPILLSTLQLFTIH